MLGDELVKVIQSRYRTLPAARLQALRVYLDSGSDDARYRQESARFHALLDQLGVKNVFHLFPGSHSWRYRREHLADSLRFVGAQWPDAQAS